MSEKKFLIKKNLYTLAEKIITGYKKLLKAYSIKKKKI